MKPSQIDLNTHLGFQLSLLKLSTIPGPNGQTVNETVNREAQQLEALVHRISAPLSA